MSKDVLAVANVVTDEMKVPILVQTAFKSVKVPITKKEESSMGKSLASLHVQREHEIDKRREAMEAIRASIDSLTQAIKKISKTLASGVEERVEEVETHLDFNLGRVKVYVKSTGKLIEERDMTLEEKQVPMEAYVENGATVKMPEKAAPATSLEAV